VKAAEATNKMYRQEQRDTMYIVFHAMLAFSRSLRIRAMILSTDSGGGTFDTTYNDMENRGLDTSKYGVCDPPPSSNELRQYLILWFMATRVKRVERVMGAPDSASEGEGGEDDDELSPPATQPASPSRTETDRRSFRANQRQRRGSIRRMSQDENKFALKPFSEPFGGHVLEQASKIPQHGNALFLAQFTFKGWKKLAHRSISVKKYIVRISYEQQDARLQLLFMMWYDFTLFTKRNWEAARNNVKTRNRATRMKAFSGWKRAADREKNELNWKTMLDRAVQQLDINSKQWQNHVEMKEQELANLTGWGNKVQTRPRPPGKPSRSAEVMSGNAPALNDPVKDVLDRSGAPMPGEPRKSNNKRASANNR